MWSDESRVAHTLPFRHATRAVALRPLAPSVYGMRLITSCGNVSDLIEDLVEIGVEILNPVQVSAMGDTAGLNARFGEELVFWGGVDTQYVLPRGSVEEVETEVRRRIHDLAPGGGSVLAAVHNIQPDVSPQNILCQG